MITPVDFTDEIIKYEPELHRIPYVHEQMMTRYERQVLCALALNSNQGNGIMEFGTWRGLTTHVLHCVTGQHIWTLDYVIPKDSLAYNPIQGTECLPLDEIGMEYKGDTNITQLIMDSMKFKAEEHSEIKNIDLCLVDGNHTYEYVKHDTEEGLKMLRQGGVLVLHDFLFGHTPDPNNLMKDNPHDGVCHFVLTSNFDWLWVKGTNFVYLEKP